MKPGKVQGTKLKHAKVDVLRYKIVHKFLCCSHTLCMNYETVPFLMACSPGRVHTCCGVCTKTQGELVGTSKSQNITAGEGRPRKVSKKARARVPLCHQLFLTDFFSAALIRPCPSEYDMEHAAKNFIPLCNHPRLLNMIKRTPTPVPNFSLHIFMINISNCKNILNRTSTYLD